LNEVVGLDASTVLFLDWIAPARDHERRDGARHEGREYDVHENEVERVRDHERLEECVVHDIARCLAASAVETAHEEWSNNASSDCIPHTPIRLAKSHRRSWMARSRVS
jgi:hypothetical protein